MQKYHYHMQKYHFPLSRWGKENGYHDDDDGEIDKMKNMTNQLVLFSGDTNN